MENNNSKNRSQIKHLRTHYVRLSLDFKPEILAEYRAACKKNGTTATTEIKQFVAQYIEANK